MLQQGDIILFQGNSITDSGRTRGNTAANQPAALGNGYPRIVTSRLLSDRPDSGLQCFNRGISGNKVPQLAARWQQDALDLKPSVISILIGVNDMWHGLNGNYKGTVDTYEQGFHDLLDRTRRALPSVRLVICEPFVLKVGAINASWFPAFDGYRAAACRQAGIFDAAFVPFQEVLTRALDDAPASYWLPDGVHPSMPGHQRMADAWLDTIA